MDLAHKLKLFNTLSGQKEEFVPILTGKASFYLCGPTVYNRSTIGNLRTYILGDILRRVLGYNRYEVTYVQNITDVGHLTDEDNDQGEDKVEKGAREMAKTAFDVADFFTKKYFEDSAKLNISRPNISCRAADHIDDQIEMIKKLEDRGFVYKTSDGIYFDTSKQDNYGKLAKLDLAGLKEGARVGKNPEKKNPTDFALWKFSKSPLGLGARRQMEWSSPWGVGFPGWHIECSAMSIKYLGQPFDIHGGGIDLIPVHHTNEIAQNEGVYGHKTVNYWVHGGFLQIDGGRMGKSLGNAYTIADIETKGFDPLSLRYLTLLTHYRQPLNFSWAALGAASVAYKKLIEKISKLSAGNKQVSELWNNKFMLAINNDLNMPEAIAVVWEMLKDESLADGLKLATVLKFDEVLGLSIEKILADQNQKPKNYPEEVSEILKKREVARKNKDWIKSDKLRAELEKLGYRVEDQNNESILHHLNITDS